MEMNREVKANKQEPCALIPEMNKSRAKRNCDAHGNF